MNRQPPITALAVTFAFLAILAPMTTGLGLAAADGGEGAVTVEPSIPINSDEKLETYQSDGVVSTGVGAPKMGITIADERDGVGKELTLNPLKGSTRNDFIRVDHREEIARTVQIPIRADYWKPFPREGLKSLDDSHSATLEPVRIDGKQYTLLTVAFDGKESAVFPIPEDAVAVYSAAESTEDRTNETFGVDLGLTPTPWNPIQPEAFTANNTAIRIEGNPDEIMIQYNAGTANDQRWVPVPEDQRRNVPVYRMQKDGVNDAVYVVTTTEDAPGLRYKQQATYGDKVGGWVNDAKELPDRITDGIGVDVPFLSMTPPVSSPGGVR